MDPNQIQVEQIRYYVNMLDFAFVSFLRLFVLTICVYILILHIQFAAAWFARHKTPEGLKYAAFIKSKLKRKRVWASLILIPLCLTLVLWGWVEKRMGPMLGPEAGITLLTESKEATLFTIRTGGFCHRDLAQEKQAYQTRDPNEIRAFVELLSFIPTRKNMYCMCCGDLSFEFYKNNQVCQAFSLHHGTHIRVQNQFTGDIYLSNDSVKALEKWLTEKGIRELQTESEAASQRLKVLGETMKAKDITEIRELIKDGADVNVRTQEGFIPLYIASKKNYIEIVKVLLDAGANVNAASQRDGYTPLMAASWLGHFEMVTLLLAAGADVNISGDDGQTSLIAAANGGYTEIVKQLLKANADVNARDNHGGTALLSASNSGNIEIVKLLLQAGADVNFAGSNGATPLFLASAGGHAEVVKLLLEAKAQVNITAIKGITPLIVASSGGHAEVVKLLLEAGADVNAVVHVDNANYSALDMAKKTGHNEVISLLKGYVAKE